MLVPLLLALAAPAADLRADDAVTIPASEVVDDDLYVFAGDVLVEGTVNGDVIAAGGTITVLGEVTGDVMLAGGTLRVAGPVGGSVRMLGGDLAVDSLVGRDLVAAGGNLVVASEATIGQDAVLGLGSARLGAPVGGDLVVSGGAVTLTAPVRGDVAASVGQLALATGAVVAGDLVYTSENEVELTGDAAVLGQVERREGAARPGPGAVLLGALVTWMRALVGLFLLGLAFVAIFPGFARRSATTLEQRPLASLGVGALGLVAAPVIAGIVFVLGLLVGGWWLGLVALGLYGLALLLTVPLVGFELGSLILRRSGGTVAPAGWALLLGLVVLLVVGAVPILGAVVLFGALLFGLGAMLLAGVRREAPAI